MSRLTIKNDVNNPVTWITLLIVLAIGLFLAIRNLCGVE